MKVKSESEVAQLCPTLRDPMDMDCSLPGSFIHGIFQARVLEWVAIAFAEGHHYHLLKFHIYVLVGNGNPLQYFCLENPMDRGAW